MTFNRNEILRILTDIVVKATLADSAEIDADGELESFGVDSILAAQLAREVSQTFGISFTPVHIFEAISLNGLANVVLHMQEQHIAADTLASENDAFVSVSDVDPNQVVIVGMACRFSEIEDLDDYWQALLKGNPTIKPSTHWPESFRGGFLKDIDKFDADFFAISPNEAKCMDPQQRVLMEVVQHSIDDSLLTVPQLQELKCGVFTTSLPGDYKLVLAEHPEMAFNSNSFTGNAFSTLSGRISYFYDFNGPSISLDTACSSGLTALHLAVRQLQSGDCQAAIVSGACVFSTPELFKFATKASMISPRGSCDVFSELADGFVPGEGAVSLVLTTRKRADALNVPVYAEVSGISLNHDGKSNGLMAPNVTAQRSLLTDVYEQHKIAPAQLAYIETHGTGTQLGDPIEMKALTDAAEKLRWPEQDGFDVSLGASKHVIGHTLTVSGLASVVKVALCFKHGKMPAYTPTNGQNALLPQHPYSFVEETKEWPADKPYAGVSAFGFTGSNAHLILKQPVQSHRDNILTTQANLPQDAVNPEPIAFCLSAKNEDALRQTLRQLKDLVDSQVSWSSLHFIAQNLCRRNRYRLSLVVVEHCIKDLANTIDSWLAADALNQTIPEHDINQLDEKDKLIVRAWLDKDTQGLHQCLSQITPVRENLPGYPFTRNSYWVGSIVTPKSTQEQQESKYSADTDIATPAPTHGSSVEKSNRAETESVLQTLLTDVSGLLGYDKNKLSSNVEIQQLGLDSLTAITLLAPFTNETTPKIQPHELFGFTTLRELSQEIANRMTPQKAGMNSEQNTPLSATPPETLASGEQETREIIHMQWQSVGGDDMSLTPILLMPPLNTGRKIWQQLLIGIRSLLKNKGMQNTPIFIPCYPGHRSSDCKQSAEFDTERFSLEGLAHGIAHFIKNELGGRPVNYVGWSLGGCLGLLMAQHHQTLLNRLVLISCSAVYGNDVFEGTLKLHQEIDKWSAQLKIVFENDEDIISAMSADTHLQLLKYYYDQLVQFDLTDILKFIQTPTLVLQGKSDPIIDSTDIEWFNQIPGVKLITQQEHGHFMPLTNGPYVLKCMREFMWD